MFSILDDIADALFGNNSKKSETPYLDALEAEGKRLPKLERKNPVNLDDFLKSPEPKPKPEPKPRVGKKVYYNAVSMAQVNFMKKLAREIKVGYGTDDQYIVYDGTKRYDTKLPEALCPEPRYDTYYISTNEGDNSVIYRLDNISRPTDDLGRQYVYARLCRVR